jgi:hypothetical protein
LQSAFISVENVCKKILCKVCLWKIKTWFI